MFLVSFIQRVLRPEQPIMARYIPLPCPVDGALLLPEAKENGEYGLYCPLCRLACQPKPLYPATTPLAIEAGQHGPQTPPPIGSRMHTQRARARAVAHLKRSKLVLMTFDGNSRPQDTDALEFANSLTEARLPRVKKVETHVE